MKHTSLFTAILILIGAFAACTINVPWDVMDDYDGVRVVMHVIPDDADVLLNGKLIGAAYEFASAGSALRLASRENELVFKEKGFREKMIDLRSYSSRTITLKVELESETTTPASATTPKPPVTPENKQAYEAQTEPVKPQPAEKPAPPTERFLTQITLTVTPDESVVYIDGTFWGLAPAAGKTAALRLPPGKYSFSAFKPGFRVYNKEIIVPKQEKFTLTIALQK
jgi:hypothetical protein